MRTVSGFWISEQVSTCCAIPTNSFPFLLLSQALLAAATGTACLSQGDAAAPAAVSSAEDQAPRDSLLRSVLEPSSQERRRLVLHAQP